MGREPGGEQSLPTDGAAGRAAVPNLRNSPMMRGSRESDVPAEAGNYSSRLSPTAGVLSWSGRLVESKGGMLLFHHRRNSLMVTGAGRILDELGQPKMTWLIAF